MSRPPSAPNPSTALARVVLDELARGGVTDVLVSPGSRSAALVYAAQRTAGIAVHVGIDERSAGFVALGYARATGRPAPVIVTSGTAAANLLPAAVEADLGGVPWLALTADRPPELRDTGANQTIEQTRLYGTATRWFHDPGVAEDRPGAPAAWRSMVCRALAEAGGLAGRPGPVQLNLPFREPVVEAADDGRARATPYRTPVEGRPGRRAWTTLLRAGGGVPHGLAALGQRLAGTRGVLLAGDAPVPAATAEAFAETLGWPLLAEPHAPARCAGSVISTAAWLAGVPAFAAAHRPDVVLRLGRSGLSRPLAGLLADAEGLLIDDGRWLDSSHCLMTALIGDPAATLEALARELRPADRAPGWLESWQAAEQRARAALDATLAAELTLSEPGAVRAVTAALPAHAALVVASSMPIRDVDAVAPATGQWQLHANRGASGIDGLIGTGLGVALGAGAPTVVLTGDLSLLHDRNAFLLDPARALDCTIVVLDNDGGGIFHHLPQAAEPATLDRLFATPHGLDLAALARMHGVPAVTAGTAGELAATVRSSLDGGGLRLILVRTDRRDGPVVRRRLAAAVADALAR